MVRSVAPGIPNCARPLGRDSSSKDRANRPRTRERRPRLQVESGVVTAAPAAVLWDMDGTVVDTEPYWMDAETELIESYGGSWTHDEALALVGQGLAHCARVMQSRGVTLGEQEIIDVLS